MGKGAPPAAPKWLLFLKIAIIVLSTIILALAAYSIAILNQYYYTGAYSGVAGLLIFVVIKTWIIYGVLTILELKAPHMFWRVIALIGYCLSVIFWLSAWAWSASIASVFLTAYGGFYLGNYDSYWKAEGAALAACAGLGAVVW